MLWICLKTYTSFFPNCCIFKEDFHDSSVHLVISQINYMSMPYLQRTGKGKHAIAPKGGKIDTLEKVLMINTMVLEEKEINPSDHPSYFTDQFHHSN